MVKTRIAAALIAAGLTLAAAASTFAGVTLNEGDILVSDVGHGVVLRIDPVTGDQTEVVLNISLWRPTGIAIEATGSIVVSEDLIAEVVRIDPDAGTRTTVSSAAMFTKVTALAVETNGNILVTDLPLGIVRIDPVSGIQTFVSLFFGILTEIGGVAVEADGQILVVDAVAGVIRADPLTGVQTTVSSGGFFVLPAGLAVAANGDILVADETAGVIRVDPVTGAQTIVSSGGILQAIHSIAVEANGDILVADTDAVAVIRIDPVSGAQSIVSSGGLMGWPWGIAVVPRLVPRYACAGFDHIADTPVTVTEPRTIPLLAELLDHGVPVIIAELAAPPVAQVTFASEQGDEPPTDITGAAPPLNPLFLGNRFFYFDSLERWLYGLLTLKENVPGTYTVTMVSGNDKAYVVEPTCTATYVVE